jgi:hypothetical protein
LETEAWDRQDIDRILQRSLPTEERSDELSRAAREFYLQAMKKKHRHERKELGLCIAVLVIVVLFVVWVIFG